MFGVKKEFSSVKITSRMDSPIGKKVQKSLKLEGESKINKSRAELIVATKLRKLDLKSQATLGKGKVIINRSESDDSRRANQLVKKITEKMKILKGDSPNRQNKTVKPDTTASPSEEKTKRGQKPEGDVRVKKIGPTAVGSSDGTRPRRPNKLDIMEKETANVSCLKNNESVLPFGRLYSFSHYIGIILELVSSLTHRI